jgi:hypothetical protein
MVKKSKSKKQKKPPSTWIRFIKAYAILNNIKYGEAMKKASGLYKSMDKKQREDFIMKNKVSKVTRAPNKKNEKEPKKEPKKEPTKETMKKEPKKETKKEPHEKIIEDEDGKSALIRVKEYRRKLYQKTHDISKRHEGDNLSLEQIYANLNHDIVKFHKYISKRK